MKKHYKIAIIGGGAAGLYLAAKLGADGNASAVLLEKNARVGKKLAVTGNGQGNVSNTDISPSHYFSGDKNIVASIITAQPLPLFDGIFVTGNNGRIYPAAKQASALTDRLIFKAERGGVDILTDAEVTNIQKGYTITLNGGEKLTADYVVLACGGVVAVKGEPYRLARAFGHTVTPLFPSLVQLKTDTSRIKSLKGLRLDTVIRATSGDIDLGTSTGEIIFAEYGVTGSAIFNISPLVTDKKNVRIFIDCAPLISQEELTADIAQKQALGYPTDSLLDLTLHYKLARAIIKTAASTAAADIAQSVKNFALDVQGALSFDTAQVTRGGIDMSEITPDLESKLSPNLYIMGEMLDVDGDCGGYNLHWAFTSALRVYDSIQKKCKS